MILKNQSLLFNILIYDMTIQISENVAKNKFNKLLSEKKK